MKPVFLIEAPEKLSLADRDKLFKYVAGVLDEHGLDLAVIILDSGMKGCIVCAGPDEDDDHWQD